MIFPCVKCANTKIQIHKYKNTQIQHMTKCQKDPTCGIFLKRGLFKGIKNDIPMCQTRKYKNTNTKYTNTQIQHMTKFQKDPTCGTFLKRGLFKGIKNDIPMCQTHKYKYKIHKYTNTAYDEVPERPNMWYIFEKGIAQGFQKLYFHVSNAQIQKYKYTNTQIRHLTKCLKDPTCGIFLKRGLFKDIKNYIQGRVFPVSGFFT